MEDFEGSRENARPRDCPLLSYGCRWLNDMRPSELEIQDETHHDCFEGFSLSLHFLYSFVLCVEMTDLPVLFSWKEVAISAPFLFFDTHHIQD